MADKVALVTGCSSGIGRATALTFHSAGWTVYATARNRDDLTDLATAGCETAALDVTDGEQVADVTDRVVDEQGRIDCLVNNAGYGQLGALEDVPTDRLHDQFDVNLYGPHRLVRAVLPTMREQGSGTIVNVSSFGGLLPITGLGPYCGSKFALEAVTDVLRAEVGRFGVDVVLVEPGATNTAFLDRAERQIDEGTDRTGAYEWLYSAFRGGLFLDRGDPLAHDPEHVARVVLEAAVDSDPDPRYLVGRYSRIAKFLGHLPESWRNRFFDGLFRVWRLADR